MVSSGMSKAIALPEKPFATGRIRLKFIWIKKLVVWFTLDDKEEHTFSHRTANIIPVSIQVGEEDYTVWLLGAGFI